MAGITGFDIPLSKISSGRFCLRHSADDAAVIDSVHRFGLIAPLTAVERSEGTYELISGHKRFAALKKLNNQSAPLYLLANAPDEQLFIYALVSNPPSSYSDLDRMKVIAAARNDFKISPENIQKTFLPLLGLAPSDKILKQYLQTAGLPLSVLEFIARDEIPFLGASGLARLDSADLSFLTESIFPAARFSSSQLTHVCEWMVDLSRTKKKPLAQILTSFNPGSDLRANAGAFYRHVRDLRFPALSDKEKAFTGKVREIDGSGKYFELKAPDGFEEEGVWLKAHIRNPADWVRIADSLKAAEAKAAALFDTLL